MGVHFSSSPLNCSKLLVIIDANNDIPNGSIKVDFNNTCIAAKHNLYYTCLRMQKAMRMYEMAHNITTFPTSSDWVTAKEFEAILDITQKQTTLVQYEKKFTAGYGPVIKKHTY